MQIKTTRHFLDCMCSNLVNYLPMLRRSLLKNVERCQKISGEFLSAKVMVEVVKDLEKALLKKQLNSTGEKIKLKLTDATGAALFKILLDFPMREEQTYDNLVRNNWLEQLNQQIIKPVNETQPEYYLHS
ncbi:MAG: hypothetical protein H7320_13755 [Ferruginibacter sp.]|nr:hypothetical protein [Ferruginibacter sp.]